jgi:nucleotide-binding universal stress UspA family protein
MAICEESKVGASLRAAHRYRLHNPDVYIELVEAGGRLAGELLLAKADLWDDVILLMGAYGHSRLRERVTGGVTEYILQHTTAPVLMAH